MRPEARKMNETFNERYTKTNFNNQESEKATTSETEPAVQNEVEMTELSPPQKCQVSGETLRSNITLTGVTKI